jgi:hypothetical protein
VSCAAAAGAIDVDACWGVRACNGWPARRPAATTGVVLPPAGTCSEGGTPGERDWDIVALGSCRRPATLFPAPVLIVSGRRGGAPLNLNEAARKGFVFVL